MNRKYFLFILQFLTSICIVSVGFASWTIVSGDSITASGAISAEDVNQSEDFIELTNTDELKYYQTGFVIQSTVGNNTEYTVGKKGIMSVTYTIHLDECKRIYTNSEYRSLKVRAYLTCTSINEDNLIGSLIDLKYNENSICSVTPKVYINGTDITLNETYQLTSGSENNVNWIEFYLNDILEDDSNDFSFVINYEFDFTSLDDYTSYNNYTSYIYPNIKKKKFHFESSALINEVE